jgi:hypothetical protein
MPHLKTYLQQFQLPFRLVTVKLIVLQLTEMRKKVGAGIADGLKKANLIRDKILVTSKLWIDQ